jgi:MFS family permease
MTAPGPPSFRGAFANRDLRLLLGAHTVSAAGQSLHSVALIVFVFQQTGSLTWVAAAAALRLLPYVLFSAFGGVVADRYDRRQVMVVSDLARAGLMVGLAALAAIDGPAAVALGISFLATSLGTPYYPAMAALLPSVAGARHLAAANAAMSTIESTAFIVGPGIGGLLLAVASPSLCFTVNAVAFGASAVGVRLVRAGSGGRVELEEGSLAHRLADGLRAVSTSAPIAALVAFVVLDNLVLGIGGVLLVPVAEELLGSGAEGYGFLNAALGGGALVAALVTNRLVSARRPWLSLAAGMLLAGLPFALLPALPFGSAAYPAMIAAGAGSILVEVLAITLLQRSVRHSVTARVFGILDALAVGAILIGSLLAPLLLSALGLPGALLVCGLVPPLLAMLGIPALRRLETAGAERLAAIAPRLLALESSALLRGTPRAMLERLAERAREVEVPAGTTVIREGDPADDLYLVADGTLEVHASGSGGGAQGLVNVLTVGAHFGEIGLLEGIPRTASVVAVTPATLVRIDGDDFLALVNGSPQVSGTLRDGIAHRLARTHPARGDQATAN